jgi:microcystin degradation protein MlrC
VRLLSDGGIVCATAARMARHENGPSAVICIGSIRLLLRSRSSMEWDTGMYFSQGPDPSQAALVFVKSPSHFRASYGPLAQRILVADTPSPTPTNMHQIHFTKATRPLFPRDMI